MLLSSAGAHSKDFLLIILFQSHIIIALYPHVILWLLIRTHSLTLGHILFEKPYSTLFQILVHFLSFSIYNKLVLFGKTCMIILLTRLPDFFFSLATSRIRILLLLIERAVSHPLWIPIIKDVLIGIERNMSLIRSASCKVSSILAIFLW